MKQQVKRKETAKIASPEMVPGNPNPINAPKTALPSMLHATHQSVRASALNPATIVFHNRIVLMQHVFGTKRQRSHGALIPSSHQKRSIPLL